MRTCFILALLLSACASPASLLEKQGLFAFPGQDDAIDMLWHGALGEPWAPPTIDWVPGEQCKNLTRPAIPVGNVCAAGIYANGRRSITLVIAPSLSESALVHEIMHAHLESTFGDSDSAHVRPEWADVPLLNEMLRGSGY